MERSRGTVTLLHSHGILGSGAGSKGCENCWLPSSHSACAACCPWRTQMLSVCAGRGGGGHTACRLRSTDRRYSRSTFPGRRGAGARACATPKHPAPEPENQDQEGAAPATTATGHHGHTSTNINDQQPSKVTKQGPPGGKENGENRNTPPYTYTTGTGGLRAATAGCGTCSQRPKPKALLLLKN